MFIPRQPDSVAFAQQQAELDDLLIRWHQWHPPTVGRGWNTKALVAGEYPTSRQYDDANGALDAGLEKIRVQAVDFAVTQMTDPHRTAIYCLARALTVGARVFTSPRLPSSPAEREIVVTEARGMLIRRLKSAGVL